MKITVVGQIEDNKTGLGKAINDFIAFSSNGTTHQINQIDISNNKKILKTAWKILTTPTDCFYFTPSGSRMGNLRDCFLLSLMRLKGKSVVTHFHNSNFGKMLEHHGFQKKFNQHIYKKVDAIILLGEKQKEMFNGFGLPNQQFKIIPNGVDDYLFIDQESLEKKHNREKTKIVYFSNMIKEKGYDFVFEVSQLFLEYPEVEFIFSGKFYDSQLENEFLNKIKDVKNITYYNGRYGDEKRDLLFDTNIFILPTQYPDETLPISMLEAIASGNYIFVTDVGVISEVVNKETTTMMTELNAEIVKNDLLKVIKELNHMDYNISHFKEHYSNSMAQKSILDTLVNLNK